MYLFKNVLGIFLLFLCLFVKAQNIKWNPNGRTYYTYQGGEIQQSDLPGNKKTVFISKAQLTPKGQNNTLQQQKGFKNNGCV